MLPPILYEFWLRWRWPLVVALGICLILTLALRYDHDRDDSFRLASAQTTLRGAHYQGFLEDGRLDLNSASTELLETLPEIGEIRAAAIVEARAARPYQSLADAAERADLPAGILDDLQPLAGVE